MTPREKDLYIFAIFLVLVLFASIGLLYCQFIYLIGVNVNVVEKKLDLLEIIMKIETLSFKNYICRELNPDRLLGRQES